MDKKAIEKETVNLFVDFLHYVPWWDVIDFADENDLLYYVGDDENGYNVGGLDDDKIRSFFPSVMHEDYIETTMREYFDDGDELRTALDITAKKIYDNLQTLKTL